jgi:hypothetical protein
VRREGEGRSQQITLNLRQIYQMDIPEKAHIKFPKGFRVSLWSHFFSLAKSHFFIGFAALETKRKGKIDEKVWIPSLIVTFFSGVCVALAVGQTNSQV